MSSNQSKAVPSSQTPADDVSSRHEVIDVINELASVLDTGLDRAAISAIVDLLEYGVTPEALVAVITELRKEALAEGQGHRR